ncbi:hypothetical protein GCM10028801_44850 [Nocardioides maradonensis]
MNTHQAITLRQRRQEKLAKNAALLARAAKIPAKTGQRQLCGCGHHELAAGVRSVWDHGLLHTASACLGA